MKNILRLLAGMVIFQITGCRKPCLSPGDVAIESVPVMKYFNSYKPSNWWVYYNSDRSKKDSIYVEEFKESIAYRYKSCVSDSSRIMKIKSTHFLKNLYATDLVLLIKSSEAKELFITFQDKYTTGYVSSPAHYSFTTVGTSWTFRYELLNSITLNSTTYTNILVLNGYNFDKYYFAENIGLVGWQSNSTVPVTTFNLVNYKVQ